MPEPIRQLARTVNENTLAEARILARSNQGIVYRVQAGDDEFAVKAAAGRGPLGAANRLALRREFRAYQRLDGLAGTPRCHGLVDGRWLVLDFVRARPFRDALVDAAFFDRLLTIIRDMHARGVAHGDLKRKDNLLIDESGRPLLLDFGAATIRDPGRRPLNHRLFEFMRQTDLNAWVKLKYGGYDAVAPEDRALLKRSLIERVLSRIRS